jgi:hypothetical protein
MNGASRVGCLGQDLPRGECWSLDESTRSVLIRVNFPVRVWLISTLPSPPRPTFSRLLSLPMHFDSHQNVIAALEARILTIRDSL